MSVPLRWSLVYDRRPVDSAARDDAREDAARAEARMVAAAQAGDIAAFEGLVQRYRNDVYALAYHYLRNREEAWDVSQEVFIKAYRGLARFRGDAALKTWLLRIAANQCKDQLKKRRLDTLPFDDARASEAPGAAHLEPAHAARARELGRAIDAAVAELSEKHRTAFLLREYEGLSYEEMAEVMQCNLGTVMSRLHHARKKLQNSLIRQGVVEDVK